MILPETLVDSRHSPWERQCWHTVLEGPVENVLIQVYTDLSRKGEVVRQTCFTMQAAMLLSVTPSEGMIG